MNKPKFKPGDVLRGVGKWDDEGYRYLFLVLSVVRSDYKYYVIYDESTGYKGTQCTYPIVHIDKYYRKIA